MPLPTLHWLARSFGPQGAYDTAVSRALLEAVASGAAPPSLRLYRPGAVLAFSLKDRQQPGFGRAVAIAREQGFDPVLRLTGGRAAVFHEQTLAFAWCRPIDDPRLGIHERFDDIAARLCEALRTLGLDARVGAVPGEYCPGEHSVNLGGRRKVVGVGQRVIRGAAHVGGVVVVRDAARIRRVLEPVYAALDYPMDPATVGSLEDGDPGMALERVQEALLASFAPDHRLAPGELPAEVLTRGHALRARQAIQSPGDEGLVLHDRAEKALETS